jgi:hypothetical protein
MNKPRPIHPLTLGLFEKRIEGDDYLLELARRRFQEAGMGAEMHAGTPEQLESALKFRPAPDAPLVVHLPRDFNLANEFSRRQIADFAGRFAGRVHGLVLHDHRDMATRPDEFVCAAREINSRLQPITCCPLLFVEYAVGLEPEVFTKCFESIRELEKISACIDVSHVGIRQAQRAYAQIHPGEDVCALKSQSAKLPHVMADTDTAVNSALPTVLNLIAAIGALGQPVHFHLHDGHPLSTFSPFGVSDHLSFLMEIPLPFEHRGRRAVPLMFGPAGLSQIVAQALKTIGAGRVSFTLEIHPTFERLPLGEAAALFGHWRDKTNAEKTNHWLAVLQANHSLLREAINAAQGASARPGKQENPSASCETRTATAAKINRLKPGLQSPN